jgi:hypothetical protein
MTPSELPYPECELHTPHFCISEMPTISMGNQNTLFIFQRTSAELRLRFFCGVPGMARGAIALAGQVWCLAGDLGVQVPYGPWWREPLAEQQGCPG